MLHVCYKAVSDYFGANMLHLRQTCCILSHNLLHCSSNHCAQKTLFNLFSSWNLFQTCCTDVTQQLETVQKLPIRDAQRRITSKETFLSIYWLVGTCYKHVAQMLQRSCTKFQFGFRPSKIFQPMMQNEHPGRKHSYHQALICIRTIRELQRRRKVLVEGGLFECLCFCFATLPEDVP